MINVLHSIGWVVVTFFVGTLLILPHLDSESFPVTTHGIITGLLATLIFYLTL